MTATDVAFLDVVSPDVQQCIRACLPAGWTIAFASSEDEEEMVRLARPADFMVGGGGKLGRTVIFAGPKLRMIHKYGIGIDKIDLAAVADRGVPLAITAGGNATPVAEHALMLMLAVSRRLPVIDKALRNGRWMKSEMRSVCYMVTGKTVGIIGFGAIGKMVARLLKGFGNQIVYYDTAAADRELEQELGAVRLPLDQLLERSDIVSLHAPLTDATRGMINAETIGRMKQGAILINTARGELVDETALYEALVAGHLRGAGLDTFVGEPPAADNPLLKLDQVVVTPHTAGGVFDNVANVANHIFRNMQRVLDDVPIPASDLIRLPMPQALQPAGQSA